MKSLMTGGLLSFALIAPLMAAETIDQTQPIGADQSLRVAIPRGTVTFTATDGDSVSIKGTLDEDTESFEFETQGDAVVIKLRLPSEWHEHNGGSKGGAKLTIQYPASRDLEYSTVSADTDATGLGQVRMESISGDFTLTGLTGRAWVESVSGDIEAKDLQGDANLESVSGDIEERGGQGEMRLHTVSGDLDVENRATRLDLESISGDIEARLGNIGQLRSRTVSGEMALKLAQLNPQGEVAAESVSGDIVLSIGGELNARVLADTGPGGEIRNGWSSEEPRRGKYVSNESLEVTLGQGSGTIRLNTVSGDLRLKK
ncbi:DUF4097 domain-containing protein [Marinobacter hydrocarbonoclasticus]|nr:DUF4097 domain-containing protein [Marinobacter nauticus]